MADFLVCYGRDQIFAVTAGEAAALANAAQHGTRALTFGARTFTTAFIWIMPADEWGRLHPEFDSDDLLLVESLARWLTNPAHNLAITQSQALRKLKRELERVGYRALRGLQRQYAESGAPSARGFLAALSVTPTYADNAIADKKNDRVPADVLEKPPAPDAIIAYGEREWV